MRTTIQHALLATALLSTTSLAQTSNYTSTCSGIDEPEKCCPNYLNTPYVSSPENSIVSTGSASFSPIPNQDEWIISVLVNDTKRAPNFGRRRYTRESFLSVGGNTSNTSVCVYQLSPINATKSSDGSGCAGVFSEDCVAFMRQAVFNATNAEWKPKDQCKDPFFTNSHVGSRLFEVCGLVLTPNEQKYSRERFVVPNDNCSYPSLPGVGLPDGYHSPAKGSSYSFYEQNGFRSGFSHIKEASTYDQIVSQVIPFAVVTSQIEGNQNNAVELVCVTPNSTLPGAPAISDGTPWEEVSGADATKENAANKVMSSNIVALAAGLASLMLAL